MSVQSERSDTMVTLHKSWVLIFPQYLVRSVAFPSFWIPYLLRPWAKNLWDNLLLPFCFPFFEVYCKKSFVLLLIFFCRWNLKLRRKFYKDQSLASKWSTDWKWQQLHQNWRRFVVFSLLYTLCEPSPPGQLLGTRLSAKWLQWLLAVFSHRGG